MDSPRASWQDSLNLGGLGIYRPDFMRISVKADYHKVEKPDAFICGGGCPWNL